MVSYNFNVELSGVVNFDFDKKEWKNFLKVIKVYYPTELFDLIKKVPYSKVCEMLLNEDFDIRCKDYDFSLTKELKSYIRDSLNMKDFILSDLKSCELNTKEKVSED